MESGKAWRLAALATAIGAAACVETPVSRGEAASRGADLQRRYESGLRTAEAEVASCGALPEGPLRSELLGDWAPLLEALRTLVRVNAEHPQLAAYDADQGMERSMTTVEAQIASLVRRRQAAESGSAAPPAAGAGGRRRDD